MKNKTKNKKSRPNLQALKSDIAEDIRINGAAWMKWTENKITGEVESQLVDPKTVSQVKEETPFRSETKNAVHGHLHIADSIPSSMPADQVNHPLHYNKGKIECIEFIEDQGFGHGFTVGNALKYLVRAGAKGDEVEDLKKAKWYISRRIEQIEASRENRKAVRPNDMPMAGKC